MVGKTAQYYRTHPKAREKKKEYDTEFNKKPSQVAKRTELAKKNREHDKKYGKASRQGKDLSHTSRGLVYKSVAANRGSKSDTAGDRRARGRKR
jgi:FKBP-type peptidyl-prolyl cis-trans isomerase